MIILLANRLFDFGALNDVCGLVAKKKNIYICVNTSRAHRRVAQRRREGNRRYKSAEGHRHARGRGRLYARGGHHVHLRSHEHPVAEGGSVARRNQQSVDGIRVHAAWRSRRSAA